MDNSVQFFKFKKLILAVLTIGVSTKSLNLSGLSESSSFGFPGVGFNPKGVLKVSWQDSNLIGVTLPPNITIFEVCFTAADVDAATPIDFGSMTEFIDNNTNVVPVLAQSGIVKMGTFSIYNTDWYLPNISPVYWNRSANGYRLPTEAEWEYAARGGNATNIYSGSDNVDEVAWYNGNNVPYGTKPVKGKSPNGYGLYDMSGNVWEWAWDWYGSYPSTTESNPEGASYGYMRIIRSGSWSHHPERCRVGLRDSYNPSGRSIYLGFRLARTP